MVYGSWYMVYGFRSQNSALKRPAVFKRLNTRHNYWVFRVLGLGFGGYGLVFSTWGLGFGV